MTTDHLSILISRYKGRVYAKKRLTIMVSEILENRTK